MTNSIRFFDERFFQNLALQLTAVRGQPSNFLLAIDSSGSPIVEKKTRGVIGRVWRWLKTLRGTSYDLQKYIQILHTQMNLQLFKRMDVDSLPLRTREHLANEILAARQVEITMRQVFTYATSRNPKYSSFVPMNDAALIESAAFLRGMTVEDLEKRLTKTENKDSQVTSALFALLPEEIIQKNILTALSRHDLYYFGLTCRQARANAFGNTEYWINLAAELHIPSNAELSAQERVHHYYLRFTSIFNLHHFFSNFNSELKSTYLSSPAGIKHDTLMAILRTTQSKPLQKYVMKKVIGNKQRDIVKNIFKVALDRNWECSQKLNIKAFLALSLADDDELLGDFLLKRHMQLPLSTIRCAIVEALEHNNDAIVKKIMQIKLSLTIVSHEVNVSDSRYIQKIKNILIPQVVKLEDQQRDDFLVHDSNIKHCLARVPTEVREQKPSVTFITIAGVRFTIVNYTNKEIGCTLKGNSEEAPFAFTFNGWCSREHFATPDNCQIVFFPGNIYSGCAGFHETLHSICRDEGKEKRTHFVEWKFF